MSEKRLTYDILFNNYYQIIEKDDDGYCRRLSPTGIIDLLNGLNDENRKLKQQLFYDGDDVCGICKYESLIPSHNYFIGKCEKGHDECSKEDVKYCEDFELKESSEWKESDLLKTILTW